MTELAANTDRRRIWLAGASGTIGSAVAHALLAGGHEVVCLLRNTASGREAAAVLRAEGAIIVFDEWPKDKPDTVVSCLASRSGTAQDAEAVDFRMNLALLNLAEERGADHFILLSAICVQRPLLAFQHAKIAFERALKASRIDHTIVRPTAFFKSLSGQVTRVLAGKPFLLFGDGELTRCKPISDADLARFIADCVIHTDRRNKVLPVGGPGPAISLKEQGELLFEAAGKTPSFRSVPVTMFDVVIAALSLAGRVSSRFAEKAEYARIGRYYATESMLVLDPATGEYSAEATPEYGSDTLLEHYRALVAQA